MLEAAHRQAAEEFEADLQRLISSGGSNRSRIGTAWNAGFHGIAYGCQRHHNQHRENHQSLAQYLKQLIEHRIADF